MRNRAYCCKLCSRHLHEDGSRGNEEFAVCGICVADHAGLSALYSKIVNRFPQYRRMTILQLFEKMWAGIDPKATEKEKRFPKCPHDIPLSTECAYCTAEIESHL